MEKWSNTSFGSIINFECSSAQTTQEIQCTGLQRWIGGFGAYQAEIDAYDDDSVEGIMFNFECVEEGIESFKLRKYAN